ncbi:MAG TPA: metal ABC transporter permease [Egibacteraceae bacterium]|nr:metal ABC transporter permease [Egibacteraceae bacterium]
MSQVIDMFSLGFMQRALVAATVVCAVAPLAGVFIVQRRAALTGDGIGHVAFAGVGLAFLVGVQPLLGALVLTVLAAIALYRMQRAGLGGDLSLALIFYGGIALGFMFASRAGGGVNTVLGFLFGSPLNLTWGRVGAMVALAAVVLVVVLALYGPLVAIAFDEPAARVSGVPVNGLVLTLTLLVSLTVVGGMYAIGLLLVSAMMVIPVAAAAQLAGSYRTTMLAASAIGAGSAVIGLTVAYVADLAPGASIVLTAIACYALAAGVRDLRARRVSAPLSRTVKA